VTATKPEFDALVNASAIQTSGASIRRYFEQVMQLSSFKTAPKRQKQLKLGSDLDSAEKF
jgi:hypothetical protein